MLGESHSSGLVVSCNEGKKRRNPEGIPQQNSEGLQGGMTMGKPRIYGMNKPFIPNSKADSRRKKPFTGAQKKGKAKK